MSEESKEGLTANVRRFKGVSVIKDARRVISINCKEKCQQRQPNSHSGMDTHTSKISS
jgi:hypothetical protein